MRERLWIVIPAAGFPFLLVLFIVLWQSLQLQKRTIDGLLERLDGLEAVEQLRAHRVASEDFQSCASELAETAREQ